MRKNRRSLQLPSSSLPSDAGLGRSTDGRVAIAIKLSARSATLTGTRVADRSRVCRLKPLGVVDWPINNRIVT